MTVDDSDLWYDVAEKYFPQWSRHGGAVSLGRALDKLLGVNEYAEYFGRAVNEDTPLSPELKHLLEMLLGPHGDTILRVYKIRRQHAEGLV